MTSYIDVGHICVCVCVYIYIYICVCVFSDGDLSYIMLLLTRLGNRDSLRVGPVHVRTPGIS